MLVRGRQLIKGAQFASWRTVGHAAQACRIHAMRGVDELVLLDIGATPEGRGPDLALVEELSDVCYMPLAVGGGVRTIEDVSKLLRAGADKVVICTAVCEVPDFIEECSDYYGAQAIVVAIDVLGGNTTMIRCGTKTWSHSPVEYAQWANRHGAGEILLTSIDREGTLHGYDLDLIKAVSSAVDIPVIANGGCGTYEHMHQALEAGADAVAAGAMFQFTDQTPKGAAEYLQARGVEVRL